MPNALLTHCVKVDYNHLYVQAHCTTLPILKMSTNNKCLLYTSRQPFIVQLLRILKLNYFKESVLDEISV